MKKPVHPALALWHRLFSEAAADTESPRTPDTFVEDDAFVKALKREKIEHPDNPIQYWEWREKIGLVDYARKLIRAEHKRRGTTPDPMNAGAIRLRRHMKRNGFSDS